MVVHSLFSLSIHSQSLTLRPPTWIYFMHYDLNTNFFFPSLFDNHCLQVEDFNSRLWSWNFSLCKPSSSFFYLSKLEKKDNVLCKWRIALEALPHCFSMPITWGTTFVPSHLKTWKGLLGYLLLYIYTNLPRTYLYIYLLMTYLPIYYQLHVPTFISLL